MRVAVTGATGFLGRNLIPELLTEGHEVRTLTRGPATPVTAGMTALPLNLPAPPETVAEAVDGCDAVVHLAAAGVSPKHAPQEMLEAINVAGLRSVLGGAGLATVPHVIVAGTWAEYGRTLDEQCPIPAYAELRPVSDYAVSKARAFLTARTGHDGPDVGVSYVRVFNAFGAQQEPPALWPSLRSAAMDGRDLRLSSGTQVRDFVPVAEVSRHLLSELGRPPAPGTIEVTNCGTGVGRSVREFAEYWWGTWGATGSLLFGAATARSWDPARAIADLGERWSASRTSDVPELPGYRDS